MWNITLRDAFEDKGIIIYTIIPNVLYLIIHVLAVTQPSIVDRCISSGHLNGLLFLLIHHTIIYSFIINSNFKTLNNFNSLSLSPVNLIISSHQFLLTIFLESPPSAAINGENYWNVSKNYISLRKKPFRPSNSASKSTKFPNFCHWNSQN